MTCIVLADKLHFLSMTCTVLTDGLHFLSMTCTVLADGSHFLSMACTILAYDFHIFRQWLTLFFGCLNVLFVFLKTMACLYFSVCRRERFSACISFDAYIFGTKYRPNNKWFGITLLLKQICFDLKNALINKIRYQLTINTCSVNGSHTKKKINKIIIVDSIDQIKYGYTLQYRGVWV